VEGSKHLKKEEKRNIILAENDLHLDSEERNPEKLSLVGFTGPRLEKRGG